MKIDTLGVQAFIAIADHGRFQKAADSLKITQTALTRRLKILEAFLGVKLVERTTRSVALTTIGTDFLPEARRLLSDLAAALVEIRETGKALRGNVSIACVPTAGVQLLPRAIQEYSARHPDNRIKILDYTSAGVVEAILRREAEFGINIVGRHHAELESIPLMRDRFVLICRKDHPLAFRKKVTWQQLQPHRLIFSGLGSSNRPFLDSMAGTGSFGLKLNYEVQRSSTAVGLAAAGVGAAVIPHLAIQSHAYPKLVVVTLSSPVVWKHLVLLKRVNSHLSPAATELYDLIRKHAGTAPSRK